MTLAPSRTLEAPGSGGAAGKVLSPPIPWFGGKSRLAARLARLLPPHQVYVEVFGGSGALLFAKPPQGGEVWNDVYGELVNFYRVLRDPEQFQQFHRLAHLTPYSRALFIELRDNPPPDDPIGQAWRFFVLARQAFGAQGVGERPTWGYGATRTRAGIIGCVNAWLNGIERLPQVHLRLRRVQVESQDFRKLLEAYDEPEALFYLDPPYVPETRVSGGYAHEMTLEDHEELVQRLLALRGKAILSGYDHPVYGALDWQGWHRLCFNIPLCCTKQREGERRLETVWISPRAQTRALMEGLQQP